MSNEGPRLTRARGHGIYIVIFFVIFYFTSEANSTIKLNFSLWALSGSPNEVSIRKFAELVKIRSDGEILINLYFRDELYRIHQGLESVRIGLGDGALLPLPYFGSTFPKIMTISFPFLFYNEEHVDKAIYSEIGMTLLRGLSQAVRVKAIAYLENGFSDIGSTRQTIVKPNDLVGLSINIRNSLNEPSFLALGIRPMRVSLANIVPALQKGIFDTTEVGIYSGFSGVDSFRQYIEIIKHVSLTQHSYSASVMFFNQDKFNSLSTKHQRILLESAMEVSEQNKLLVRRGRESALSELTQAGINIARPDRAGMRLLLEKLFENPPEGISKEILDAVKKACRWPPFCK